MMHGLVHFRYNLQWRLSCLNPFSMTFTMLLFSHIHILLELSSYLVSCFQQSLTRAQHNNIPAPVNIRKNDGQIIGFYNWWSVPWQAGSVPEDNKRYWICPLLNYTFQVSLSMFEAQPAASSIVTKPITICKHQKHTLSWSLSGQAAQHLQKTDFVCSSIMVLTHC